MKISAVDERSISSTTGCSICAPRCPPQEKRPGSRGSSVSMSSGLSSRPCTSCASSAWRGPSSALCASSRLPSVADRPHTTSCGFQRRSRASASCTCTPRLLPISSCHSSTITTCSAPKSSRDRSRVSSSVSDSGVVTSAVGSRRSWRARSAAGVSPVRRPTRHCGASSASGCCSARAVSAASARIGVSHSTCSAVRAASTSWRALQRAQPHRIGLAAAGGGMQQAAAAFAHRRPDLALEVEDAPAPRLEPGIEGGVGCRQLVHGQGRVIVSGGRARTRPCGPGGLMNNGRPEPELEPACASPCC